MPWMVPFSTRRLISALAASSPKDFEISLSSISGIIRLPFPFNPGRRLLLLASLVVVGNADLAVDELLLQGVHLGLHLGGEQLGVAFVLREVDALVRQAVALHSAL